MPDPSWRTDDEQRQDENAYAEQHAQLEEQRRKEPKKVSAMVPRSSDAESEFRHSHWKEKRAKVHATLVAAHRNDFALNRFEECGSQCVVEWSPTAERYRLVGKTCRCRHCEPCMRSKANTIAANLISRLSTRHKRAYRFMTFTLKHSDAPLHEQIQRLYSCFKKLRTYAGWKRTQRGGAVMLEVKRSTSGKSWHVHCHAIVEGDYLDKQTLSDMWHQATGDSFIADIRALQNAEEATHYVAKYITKGTDSRTWSDPAWALEWVTSTANVRSCGTFGTWRGFALLQTPTTITDWRHVCTLDRLCAAVKRRNPAATEIYLALRPPAWTEEKQATTRSVESG